jgi:hypothetical protein
VPHESGTSGPEIQIQLRDPKTAKILGVDKSGDGRFLVLQPKGSYLVKID